MGSISGISGVGASSSALSAQRASHQARMFAKVDTDGNGSVNQAELDTMIQDISQKSGTSLGDSKELFTKMDSNGDGSLSSDELQQGMKQLMPPPSTMEFAQRLNGDEKAALTELYNKLDQNGDGSLDTGELKALADKMKSDTGKDISGDLSKLDSDGDGKVTKAEFEAGRPQAPQGAEGLQGAGGPPPAGGPGGAGAAGGAASASGAQKAQSYDPADTNQDGVVSEMERLAAQLKELSSQEKSSSSGDTQNQLIAQLARKLYDQISSKFMNQEGSSAVSLSA